MKIIRLDVVTVATKELLDKYGYKGSIEQGDADE